jgi:hypothetical protein
LTLVEPDLVMGIRSCLCWRETEICLAIEISAAILRFSSRSSYSLSPASLLLDFGIDVEGEQEDILRFSDGRGRIVDEVVALRERVVGGGACICVCLGFEDAL